MVLAMAFMVAMISGGEPNSSGPVPGSPTPPRPAGAAARHPVLSGRSNAGLTLAEEPGGAEPAAPGLDEADSPAHLGAYTRPEPPASGERDNFAPPLGFARDPEVDRPTPQQVRRLIAQSYARSGSEGGGD